MTIVLKELSEWQFEVVVFKLFVVMWEEFDFVVL
jgi:hypothetical protein